MPELPEVETLARGLRPRLLGRRIESLVLYRASMLTPASAGLDQLHAARITALRRAGKYLVFELSAHRHTWQWMFHLGMTGQLLLRPANAPLLPHTHLVATLTGGFELHFRDPRRFGRIALAPVPSPGHAFSPLLHIPPGAEPLEISADAFVALFSTDPGAARGRRPGHPRSYSGAAPAGGGGTRPEQSQQGEGGAAPGKNRLCLRHAPIKSALMNQKLLRGLGNIYADESLFRAAIHPSAHLLSAPRLRRLRLAIRRVLRQAIAAGGSSISDYVDSRGQPGWFQLHHCVYGRTGEPCPRCGTPIRSLVLAGRTAHFCPHCQKR